MRSAMLSGTAVLGVLALLGAVWFAWRGAGIFGSPFSGALSDDASLLAVLVCGPGALLPAVLIESRKPGWGAVFLSVFSLVESALVAWFNLRAWGFALHDAALGSLVLALPLIFCGTALFWTAPSAERSPVLIRTWQSAALLALLLASYYLVQVGADGWDALQAWLSGGTI